MALPVDETKLMDGFYSKGDLGHVEAGDVLGENLVLNEHGHEVTAGQELHEHVEERAVLEGGVQLDDPRTVRLCENVALGTDVGQLVLFKLFEVSILCTKLGRENRPSQT